MTTKLTCLLATAVVLASTTTAAAAQLTVPALQDATIFQNNVNNGSGFGNGLFAGTNGMTSPRRALMAFDLSSIPATAVVTAVELRLVLAMTAGGSGGNQTVEVHPLSDGWGEAMTQQSLPNPSDGLGGQGQGVPALAGDVTWNSQFHDTDPWATAGGDFGGVSASLAVGSTSNATYAWTSTPQLVADVQGWLANPAVNYGWLLKVPVADESVATNFRAFFSRNVATAAFRPALAVTFEIPEPSGVILGALAGAGLALMKRAKFARSACRAPFAC